MAFNLGAEPFDPKNKPTTSSMGRSDTSSGNSNSNQAGSEAYVQHSHTGTVMIRATVEHLGLAGDTEMTVTVKWPASTFCVQPGAESPVQDQPVAKSANVPPNGPAAKNLEPGTLYGETVMSSKEQNSSEKAEPNQGEKG
jgi:hypothetical protein